MVLLATVAMGDLVVAMGDLVLATGDRVDTADGDGTTCKQT